MNPTPPPSGSRPSPSGKPSREKKRKPWWAKALKITGITVASLVAIFLLVITAVVTILNPDRLTPLVEKFAGDYINGELKVARVELTFWHTFPRLRVDIDSLTVTSGSLDTLPDSIKQQLPPDATRLLHVDHFDGDIHLPRLLTGEIEVYNTTIVKPAVNIVQATPEVANYDIFPTTEEVDTTASGPLPDISIGSFIIEGDAPINYVSLPDSTHVNLTLATSSLTGGDPHSYTLQIKGITDARVTDINLNGLRLGLGGRVIFDLAHPEAIEVKGLELGLNELIAKVSGLVETDPAIAVKKMEIDVPRVALSNILAMLPEVYRKLIPRFETDMTLAGRVKLTAPYIIGGKDTIPSLEARLELDADRFKMDRVDLNKLSLDVNAKIDGHTLDKSVFTLKKLEARGNAVGIKLDGTVRNPVSDPAFEANFDGSLDMSRLPAILLSRLPMTLKGKLQANATFKGRLSYLNRENFHRVKASGKMELNGFVMKMRDGSMDLFLRHGRLNLGTSDSFVRHEHKIDSMLTVSLKVDTASLITPDITLGASDLKGGLGMMNRAQSSDTSIINPIGATFHIGNLNMVSEADTMRVRLRDVNARAALTRYHGATRKPLLTTTLSAKRIRWADALNRASLTDGKITLKLHPTDFQPPKIDPSRREALRARRQAMRDSIAALDSLDRREMVEMQVDRSLKKMLIRWQASGSVNAAKARLMTPFFPLRCRLENVNIDFTTDSITINDTRLIAGKSDFTLSGSLSNIVRAVVSGRSPIRADFILTSNNLDVNELANAAFAGSAFAEKVDNGQQVSITNSDNDEIVQASIENSTDEIAALLVPSNIEADLSVHARHVTYSDMKFTNMAGTLRVHDGALNIDDFTATSDMGSLDLTALYTAPTRRDINFAFGMRLNDFKIENFMKIMPTVDSIMPLLRDIRGIINAEMAATTTLDPHMNINLPDLSALLTISGDSLVLLDAETFRAIGKWLLFKDKQHNMIDHMEVRLVVKDNQLQLYPFIFDMDRYRLGVMGSNDLALNFKYHVSVLKSPIPFKFGINVSGNPDKMKVRLGGAKLKENMVGQSTVIADTTRINLLRSIQSAFRKGVKKGKVTPLQFAKPSVTVGPDEATDTISSADSLIFIRQGLIQAPAPVTGS